MNKFIENIKLLPNLIINTAILIFIFLGFIHIFQGKIATAIVYFFAFVILRIVLVLEELREDLKQPKYVFIETKTEEIESEDIE